VCHPFATDLHLKNVEEAMADKHYIDPKGYWVCPEGEIRRFSDEDGQHEVIVKKTPGCSDAEWKVVCDALMMARAGMRSERTIPQFHVEQNRVVIS
jgi:hypothetical protein